MWLLVTFGKENIGRISKDYDENNVQDKQTGDMDCAKKEKQQGSRQ
jgi:hypothetical protein